MFILGVTHRFRRKSLTQQLYNGGLNWLHITPANQSLLSSLIFEDFVLQFELLVSVKQ